MSRRINRREFVMTGTAAGLAAAAAARRVRTGAHHDDAAAPEPVVISSANGNRFKNGGDEDLRRDGVRDDDEGRATCSTR